MQFLLNTHVDFMKYRVPLVICSVLVALGSLVLVMVEKLNIGIDFAGGSQVTLQFKAEPNLDDLRAVAAEAGFPEAVIQRFGGEGSHEVLIRTATVPGEEEGSSDKLLAALDRRYNAGASTATDLNRVSSDSLSQLLAELDATAAAEGSEAPHVVAARSILGLRREQGMVTSWDEVRNLPGISPQMAAGLERSAHLGDFALLAVENVGPQIGGELKSQGIWAVVFSLLAMLAYIALRFELRFGIGAIVAIFHDVTITLGLYALMGYEFNLTTIAAFLTLVGYSVNDTVVIFDRVRENMHKSRRENLFDLLNTSLNQTLSRTIMTSGTTLLTVLTLYLFGGDVLRGFSFILLIGIIIGTYSTIYIASPIVLWWEDTFGKSARVARAR